MAYDGSLKFDTKVDSNGFSSGISKLKSTALSAISAIGAAFASGAIAKALVNQIALVEQYGSAINDQSQKIGITTKAYQELSYIMGQVGGNVDILQTGIKTLSSAVVDGNKAFEQLGISLDEARAMSQEDLFNTVIERLAAMESGTLRTSLATDLFGRSATELAPLLNMGAAGIAKMRQEAQSYGLIMTDEAVAATDAYGDAAALAQKSGEALRNALVGSLMPALTKIAMGFAEVASEAGAAFSERGLAGIVDVINSKFPVATSVVYGLTAAMTAYLIVNTVKKGVDALTKAQGLLNLVMSANPVLIVAAAIGVLVAAVALAIRHFDQLNPEIAQTRNELKSLEKQINSSADAFQATAAETEKQRAKFDGLIAKLAELSAAYSGSNIEQAQMQTICDTLNGSVSGLSVTFDAQTGKLSQTTDAMYDLVAAQYDAAKSSAALKRYEEILGEQINAEFEQRKAYAEWSKYFDPTTGISLASGKARYSFAVRTAEIAAETNLEKSNKTLEKASENTQLFGEYMEELGVQYVATTDAAEETTDATDQYSESLTVAEEAQERVIISGEDVTRTLANVGMSADDASSRLDTFTGAATNMFEKISTKSQWTVKQMIANLVANTATIEQWGANIAILGEKLPESLLQPLIDQGPDKMAGVVQTLAKASDEELAALVAAFEDGGTAAMEAWYASLGAGTDKPPQGAIGERDAAQYGSKKEMVTAILGEPARAVAESDELNTATETAVTDAKAAMEQAVTDSDFGTVGKEITSAAAENLTGARQLFYDAGRYLMMGFIIGMLSRKAEIEADARMLARAANDAFNDALEVASPSKASFRSAKFYGQGFINGLRGQREPVAKASSDLAQSSLVGLRSTLTAQTPATYGAGLFDRAYKTTDSAAGTTINAPITVQGVVESDAKLARRVRNEFQEVVLYDSRR